MAEENVLNINFSIDDDSNLMALAAAMACSDLIVPLYAKVMSLPGETVREMLIERQNVWLEYLKKALKARISGSRPEPTA